MRHPYTTQTGDPVPALSYGEWHSLVSALGRHDALSPLQLDETCAAIQDIYEDTRSIVEPAGALGVGPCPSLRLTASMVGSHSRVVGTSSMQGRR